MADRLGSLIADGLGPVVSVRRAVDGGVTVRVGAPAVASCSHDKDVNHVVTEVERLLGPVAYGRGAQTIQESLVALLAQQGRTVVTAESCTGGLVGKMITDVPGASDVYLGGWIVYANPMKTQQLGVSQRWLQESGAVSEPVVRAMAIGAVERSGADLSIAITGIAGPEGGTSDKPVGTVWIGLGFGRTDEARPIATDAFLCQFRGDRRGVRDRAAKGAVQLLRFSLLGAPAQALGFARGFPRIG